MLTLTEEPAAEAMARSRAMSPDGLLVDAGWLAARGALVVAQASGTFLDDAALGRYLQAVGHAGSSGLLVVTRDPAVEPGEVRRCAADPADLAESLDAVFGTAFTIMPERDDLPSVVVTTADYRLLVGPAELLTEIVGSPSEALRDFQDWCDDPNPELRRLRRSAAAQMNWIA